MSSARHARPRQSRSGVTLLVLVTLLALGLAGAAAFTDDPALLQATVVTTAALAVVAALLAWRTSRRTLQQAGSEARALQLQLSDVRRELSTVRDVGLTLAGEVARLRAHLEEFVLPISAGPEPVYPSLHLPLVRAAFGGGVIPDTDAARPVPPAAEVPPTVSADAGSEGRSSRQLVDLTRTTSPDRVARGA